VGAFPVALAGSVARSGTDNEVLILD